MFRERAADPIPDDPELPRRARSSAARSRSTTCRPRAARERRPHRRRVRARSLRRRGPLRRRGDRAAARRAARRRAARATRSWSSPPTTARASASTATGSSTAATPTRRPAACRCSCAAREPSRSSRARHPAAATSRSPTSRRRCSISCDLPRALPPTGASAPSAASRAKDLFARRLRRAASRLRREGRPRGALGRRAVEGRAHRRLEADPPLRARPRARRDRAGSASSSSPRSSTTSRAIPARHATSPRILPRTRPSHASRPSSSDSRPAT